MIVHRVFLVVYKLFFQYFCSKLFTVVCGSELTIRVLGYVDDAALADEKIEDVSKRLTQLADASVEQADMVVRMDKTFTHHVKDQEKQTVNAEEVMAAQRKFERHFKTTAAMYTHRASCPYNYATTEKAFELEKIVGVFDRLGSRWFLVKYTGYPESE